MIIDPTLVRKHDKQTQMASILHAPCQCRPATSKAMGIVRRMQHLGGGVVAPDAHAVDGGVELARPQRQLALGPVLQEQDSCQHQQFTTVNEWTGSESHQL